MTRIRRPAVAGRFYPRQAGRLAETVDALLDAVELPGEEALAAAYVVPHAGYRFSGPTAAQVFARLRRHAAQIRRVVLVGPAHFVPLAGCAAPSAAGWATPLGELPVEDAAGLGDQLAIDDAPHAPEHSLEVQLPFVQRALDRPVPILPIAVGRAPTGAVAAVIAAGAASDPGSVVLCSTDLSHYLDLAAACARDARTAAAVTALAPELIGTPEACGAFALRGLISWARDTGLRPQLLELSTSAAASGDPSRVVGYGAFALYR